MLGKRHSETTKKLMSKSMSGLPSARRGKHLTEQHKINISKNHAHYWLGKHLTDKRKKELRLASLKAKKKYKETKIELKIQEQLTKLGVTFETQSIHLLGIPDIYIHSLNLCIFADGCYYHGCPEHRPLSRFKNRFYTDFTIKAQLELEGYKVVRLWEHDIKKVDFNINKYLQGN